MIEFLRFKLATLGKSGRRERFNYNDPTGDLAKPEKIGTLAGKEDYDLGTPNLERNENVALVCSNSFNRNSLALEMKWRPNGQHGIATLLTDLKLSIAGVLYHYQQVETYRPEDDSVHPQRFTQYGSKSSSLKFFVSNPYRQMRLLFRGYMKSDQLEGKSVFVRLNLVMTATSDIFDFLDQYDPECFRLGYAQAEPALRRSHSEAFRELLLHDRHEHSVTASGECLIPEVKVDEEQYFWGFYSREFLPPAGFKTKTTRILGYASNGQAFHLASNQLQEDSLPFGYTVLSIVHHTVPISRPFRLSGELSEASQRFQVELSGQGLTLTAEAKRLDQGDCRFHELQFNEKAGWAFVSFRDHAAEGKADAELVAGSESEYLASLEKGSFLVAEKFEERARVLLTNIEADECRCSDLVGAKAASLAQLWRRQSEGGYKVAKAFVLTKFAHDSVLAHNKAVPEMLSALEQKIAEGQVESLKADCELLQRLVEGTPLPPELMNEVGLIAHAFREQYGVEATEEMRFAVRSSSWGEDEDYMSAAGQLSTVLGVRGPAKLPEAIMRCLASKFTYENVEYKRQHGLPLGLPMAVVVQEMVACEKAGVMFTCEPATGDHRLTLITANYGLGESVVSGQSEPDSLKVRQDESGEFRLEDVRIGSKSVVVDEETLSGANSSKQYERNKCCLSEAEALALADCGRKLKLYYRQQLDVEWGFKGGKLHLFQARPVTGLDIMSTFELMHEADRPSRAENNFLTRANVGEVIPFALSPMSITFYLNSWAPQMGKLARKCEPSFEPPQMIYTNHEVNYVAYHTFFNLRLSMFFMFESATDEEPNSPKSLLSKSLQVGIFGRVIEDTSAIIEASRGIIPAPNAFFGTRYQLQTFFLRNRTIPTVTKQKAVMSWLRSQVSQLKLAEGYEKNKLLGLYNQLNNILRHGEKCIENHMFVIRIAGSYNIELSMFLTKYVKEPNLLYSSCAKFLAISPNVISAEIPHRIEKITSLLRSKPKEELESFANEWDTEQCIAYLKGDEQLAAEYEHFLRLFGHRCYNEFELLQKSWATDQSAIVDMLRLSCTAGRPDADGAKRKLESLDDIIGSIERECGKQMEAPDKDYLKRVLAPKVQLMVAAREHTKDALIDYTDILRQAAWMLAREFRKQLRIPDEELFFYLFYEDLRPLIREPQPKLVCRAIRRRNMFKQFSQKWIFDEIVVGHKFLPNHLKPSKELDEKLAKAPKLYGTPASCGRVQAKICLVEGYHQLKKVRAGEILLTHSTDIAFSPVFPLIRGIITEVGGTISHGAVVAREWGLPSVLGIPEVTRIIKDGEEVLLDADNGVIVRLELAGA